MKACAALALLLCCAAIRAGDSLLVTKCCGENEYMDVAEKRCPREPATHARARKRFGPPLWLPEWLRGESDLEVTYSGIYGLRTVWRHLPQVVLDPEEQLVRRLLAVDADARRFVLEPFGDAVDVRSVARQQVCFDATLDPRRPFVVATWLLSVTLGKCCAEGARLNGRLQCEPPGAPRRRGQDIAMDYLRPLNGNSTPWVPAHVRHAVPAADVFYDILREISGAESAAVVNADDQSAWRLLFSQQTEEWVQAVWVRAGGDVVGATVMFCLDATEADSGLPARVLLAWSEHVSKCCRRGQQLDAREMQCVPRTDMEVDARFTELLAPDDPSAYWLPRPLVSEGAPVHVRYRENWDDLRWRLVFPAERARVVRFPDRPPAACVRMRKPSGREHVACATEFCFDTLDDVVARTVVAVPRFDHSTVVTVHKCCHQGQMLQQKSNSHKILCQQDASETWNPENSSLAAELYDDRLYVAEPLIDCVDQAFTLVKEPSEQAMNKLVGVGFQNRFDVRYYCKDLLRGSDGGPARDVMAFCEVPPAAELFEKVRPLHVLAVVLLLAAVGVILAQRALHRTVHGRALACHAACLMTTNVLQAAWFLLHKAGKSCDGFAYAIYFFLVAGAFWLNVISVNMAQGFRHTQGARSREGGSGGRRRWRLALLYAWGLPAALTAVCIAAHQWEEEAERRGYATPTFFETRTCFIEYHRQSRDLQGNLVEESRQLGAVYYYYMPCGALVAVNAVCLGMTLCRIRALRSDALCLQREPGQFQSALLYVKLLLTGGVLELVLEVAAWGFRPHVTKSRLSYYNAKHVSYMFSVLGTFLDVARAGAVLWLAVGRLERVRATWCTLRARFCPWLRPRPNDISDPAPITATTSCGFTTSESTRL